MLAPSTVVVKLLVCKLLLSSLLSDPTRLSCLGVSERRRRPVLSTLCYAGTVFTSSVSIPRSTFQCHFSQLLRISQWVLLLKDTKNRFMKPVIFSTGVPKKKKKKKRFLPFGQGLYNILLTAKHFSLVYFGHFLWSHCTTEVQTTHACMLVCVCVFMFGRVWCLPVSLSLCLFVSVLLPLCLSVCLSVCLSAMAKT